jgi:cell division protein FtsQ
MNLVADLLIVVSVAALVWAGLAALQRLPVFPLRELVVTSAPARLSADQLEHSARTAVIGNFFTVDLEAARNAFEKLPWVRKATVQRHWPDGLKLMLEEHEAAAQWHHLEGESGLVNRQGEIFVADLPANAPMLPVFSGPAGSAAEMLQRHAEFSASVSKIGRQIRTVSLSPRLAWRLKLDDGVMIDLGREQERHPLAERLTRFVEHYDKARERVGSLRIADMRYPNGFALVRAGAAEPAGAARTVTTGRKS